MANGKIYFCIFIFFLVSALACNIHDETLQCSARLSNGAEYSVIIRPNVCHYPIDIIINIQVLRKYSAKVLVIGQTGKKESFLSTYCKTFSNEDALFTISLPTTLQNSPKFVLCQIYWKLAMYSCMMLWYDTYLLRSRKPIKITMYGAITIDIKPFLCCF